MPSLLPRASSGGQPEDLGRAAVGDMSCPEQGTRLASHWTRRGLPCLSAPGGQGPGRRWVAGGSVGPGPGRCPQEDGFVWDTINGPLCSANPAHLADRRGLAGRPQLQLAAAGHRMRPGAAAHPGGLWEPDPSREGAPRMASCPPGPAASRLGGQAACPNPQLLWPERPHLSWGCRACFLGARGLQCQLPVPGWQGPGGLGQTLSPRHLGLPTLNRGPPGVQDRGRHPGGQH